MLGGGALRREIGEEVGTVEDVHRPAVPLHHLRPEALEGGEEWASCEDRQRKERTLKTCRFLTSLVPGGATQVHWKIDLHN